MQGFVKSVGAVFHPVWEQQEGSGCLLVIQGSCTTLNMCLASP
jgi:hypothetical protein